ALVYKDQHLTYRELNRQTNRLARLLRKKGVQPDGIVGLMISRSPDMIIAMLGILKAGGAYLAIDKDVPMNRITAILEDSGVTLLITDLERMGNAQAVMFEELKKIFAGEPGLNLPPVNHVKNLAYVIFTSGSSGKPKGVMVEHRGLVNYTCWAAQQYVKNERVNFPLYTPVSFDLTVTSIFTPLITGNAIIVLGEEEKELVIDKIIENTNIGVIKLTPAHLTMMRGKKIGSHSHVRRLIVGGEQLESSLARDITGSFAGDIEIYNEYGPTEAVVGCMIHRFNPLEDQGESVPIGSPIHNAQIYILDKDLHPVPDGVSGEIFIGGHCLARGYLNNPGLTSEKFDQDLWDEKDGQDESGALRANFQHSAFIIPHSNLYCTGDLARRLKNGNIEFLGRIDKQIKIRGYRVELGEIENRLMSHKKINDAAVVVKEDGAGDKYLAAYVVLYPGPGEKEPGVEVKELKEYLAQTLPDYMIPGFITFLGKIPLNSNGKVDIKKLPEVSYDFRIIYTPPRNDREKKMVEIWARNLGIPADKISIDANYFELGGHSLKATLLLSLIHKEFDVRLPLSEIFERPTIRELAEFFQNTVTEQFISIEPAEKKDYYGLSSAQRRLFVLQQMEQESTAYNIRVAVELEGETGKEKLEQAFGKLIARHESLRTSFGIQNGVPYQRIHDKEQLAFEIEYYDHVTSSVEVEKIAQDFDRAFDFSKAPLIRVGLVKMSHIRHILLVNMAHIITDGISHNILIKDLSALYNGRELPPLELQYKDFSEWEQNESSREMFQEQEKYWLKEFTGEIPVLNLPYDFPRPTRKSFAGKAVDFEVSDAETKALREISRSQGVTPFMALMAIYDIFLSKL
ncbi:MAG: amino acid adenylation domain-containing protein, partial [Acidobacteria bacterium]|nr:amino acid adenylation domain-containing protein [Acidobacteriota bacterium]